MTNNKSLDFTSGPVYQAGMRPVKTGEWRVFRPEIDTSRCNKCMLCWIYCPDGAIRKNDGKVTIDYEYCKGCGICSVECGARVISMVKE